VHTGSIIYKATLTSIGAVFQDPNPHYTENLDIQYVYYHIPTIISCGVSYCILHVEDTPDDDILVSDINVIGNMESLLMIY
jgi:hypothetical protein